MRRKVLNATEFITIWQTSEDMKEVRERTGQLGNTASVRACRYRKMGIPLKILSSPVQKLDIEKLTALVKQLEKDS